MSTESMVTQAEPAPGCTIFTLSVGGNASQLHTQSASDVNPQHALAEAISVLQAEARDAANCPFHKSEIPPPPAASAVSTEELERLVAHVRGGGPHEWGYRDLTDGTFIADDWPFDAAEFLSRLQGER